MTAEAGKTPKTVQITGRIASGERREFERYAREFGLDAAGLLALLLSREIRIARLETLLGRYGEPATPEGKVTVTAHLRDPAIQHEMRTRARACRVSVSRACATLVRAEIVEKWLAKAIRLDSSREWIKEVI